MYMSDFLEWMTNFTKKVTENPAKDLDLSRPSLQQTTIKQEFDKFVRRHFMIDTSDYIGMLCCKEAYKNPSEREVFIDNKTTYQSQLSTDRIAVYIRGSYVFKTMFICIHGTKVSSVEDLYQDSRLVMGMVKDTAITTRYLSDILRIVNQSKIPRDNIYVCGHSLGGFYALLGGYISNTNVRTFNGVNEVISISNMPETVLAGDRRYSLTGLNTYKQAIAYRMFGDPISLLNKWSLANVITIKVENMSVNPLTLHSLDYMTEVCVPEIPLNKRDFTRERRFNRLPLRNEMETEGENINELREETEDNFYKKLLRLVEKSNI